MAASFVASLARRVPFYYGWIIVLGAFLCSFVYGTMGGWGFSVYMTPMSTEMGWSRTALVFGLTLSSISSAFLGPKFGVLVDKYGPSKLILVTALTGGFASLLMSRVQELWQFYVLFVIAGSVGGGVLHVAAQATVTKWFVRLRGRAVALSALGGAAPGALLTPLITFIVINSGWRAGWLLSTLLFLTVMLPVSFFMLRKPEDVGLLPDGAKTQDQVTAASHKRAHESKHQWTRAEALQTRTLWLLVASFVASGVAISGVILHEISFITDRGYSQAVAASVLSTHAGMAMVLRLPWGMVMERIPVRYGMALIYSGCALAIVVLLLAPSQPFLYVFGFLYGGSIAGAAVTQGLILANYYGREHIGSIQGAISPITIFGHAGGPLLVAFMRDQLGSYTAAWIWMLVMFLISVALAILAKPPVYKGPEGVPSPIQARPVAATGHH